MTEFRRDRLTWVAYAMLGWFAYLQASPGLVVSHLRDELDLSYSAGGLHVAAFAAGSVLAGLTAGALERRTGRRALFWLSAAGMGAGTVGLTAARVEPATVGAMAVMGWCGGLLLITIQAVLSDRHGERRTIALTEANVAASAAYVILIGGLSLAAVTGAGWRAALLGVLVVPPLAWWLGRREPIEAPPVPPPAAGSRGGLPVAFWIAAAMLFCTTCAEWCVTAWGASFVEDAAGVPVDTAVALMIGYFAGVLAGRIVGSRLARRIAAPRLLAGALALTAIGFAILWPASAPGPALAGLLVIGLGLGNLFPLGLSITVGLAPERAQLASGRAITVTAVAVLLAPLTVGALADATSLTAALGVVPVALALAAAGLGAVARGARAAARPP
jgi:fucose permease